MLKKQDLGINPHVPKNGSRDQSLTGIGGPRVYVRRRQSRISRIFYDLCSIYFFVTSFGINNLGLAAAMQYKSI